MFIVSSCRRSSSYRCVNSLVWHAAKWFLNEVWDLYWNVINQVRGSYQDKISLWSWPCTLGAARSVHIQKLILSCCSIALTKRSYQDVYYMIKRFQGAIPLNRRLERHANFKPAILIELANFVPISENDGKEGKQNFGVVLEKSDRSILILYPLN